jgi:hypothetical protein
VPGTNTLHAVPSLIVIPGGFMFVGRIPTLGSWNSPVVELAALHLSG